MVMRKWSLLTETPWYTTVVGQRDLILHANHESIVDWIGAQSEAKTPAGDSGPILQSQSALGWQDHHR